MITLVVAGTFVLHTDVSLPQMTFSAMIPAGHFSYPSALQAEPGTHCNIANVTLVIGRLCLHVFNPTFGLTSSICVYRRV